MNKIRFFLTTTKGKVVIASFTTIVIISAIFLPIIFLTDIGNKTNSVVAYNYRESSDIRTNFETIIEFESDVQEYSENVSEISSVDEAIDNVIDNEDTIAYVPAISVYDYQNQQYIYSDINILSLNGVDPTMIVKGEEMGDGDEFYSIAEYDAKYAFNIFFRVNEEDSQFIYDNMFFNADQGNVWTDGGGWNVTNLDPNSQLVNMSVQNQLSFIYSFAFFNWIIFSSSAESILVFGVVDEFGQDPYQNFDLTATSLDIYLTNNYDFLSNNNGSSVVIYSQGSALVTETLNQLFYDPNYGFFVELETATQSYINYDINVSYQSLNYNSDDAFSSDVSLDGQHVWIGVQSRSLEPSEAQNFGYVIDESSATMPQDGFFYPSLTYTDGEWIPYYSFETRLIVFITNSKTTYNDENNNEVNPQDIYSLGVVLIYTENFYWNDLYELSLLF